MRLETRLIIFDQSETLIEESLVGIKIGIFLYSRTYVWSDSNNNFLDFFVLFSGGGFCKSSLLGWLLFLLPWVEILYNRSMERFYSTYRGGIRAVPWDVCNDLFDFSMKASDFLGYLEDRQYSGGSFSCPCSGMSYIGDFASRGLRDFIAYRVGISIEFASFVAYLQRPYNCSWFSGSSPGRSIIRQFLFNTFSNVHLFPSQ